MSLTQQKMIYPVEKMLTFQQKTLHVEIFGSAYYSPGLGGVLGAAVPSLCCGGGPVQGHDDAKEDRGPLTGCLLRCTRDPRVLAPLLS